MRCETTHPRRPQRDERPRPRQRERRCAGARSASQLTDECRHREIARAYQIALAAPTALHREPHRLGRISSVYERQPPRRNGRKPPLEKKPHVLRRRPADVTRAEEQARIDANHLESVATARERSLLGKE